MTKDELTKEVERFRALRREGGYWDFKECYHKNDADLLLDIICMANNQEDRDAYIIFGISSDNVTVTGVENDPNRWDLNRFSQFLRSKSFAVYTPEIDLQTIELESHEVDVLTVFNTAHTPYYLEKEFKRQGTELFPEKIYTRLNDTNVGRDKNKVTPFFCVEHLWRKRFGIDLTPFERFKIYLKDADNWSDFQWDNMTNGKFRHYKPHPEFQIQSQQSENADEPIRFFYHDCQMFKAPLRLNYFTTTLHQTEMYIFDGGRFEVSRFQIYSLSDQYSYYYLFLDDIDGLILHLMTNGKCICEDRIGTEMPFLIFHNKTEKSDFDSYFISKMTDNKFVGCMKHRAHSKYYMIDALRREKEYGRYAFLSVEGISFCFEVYRYWRLKDSALKYSNA